MKFILSILFFLTLLSCNSTRKDKVVQHNKNQVSEAKPKAEAVRNDTIEINSQKYIQTFRGGHFLQLKSLFGDTVVPAEDYYFKMEQLDINQDGLKDIRVFTFGSIPNDCQSYLYDPKSKTFKLIQNCDLDIKKLRGTDFYYSYNRNGCSDLNWESRLSKIENYELVNYGLINGKGCDYKVNENPQIIEIYKITNSESEEKTLIKKLPYLKYIPEFDDKWDFIDKYWKENNKVFEQ